MEQLEQVQFLIGLLALNDKGDKIGNQDEQLGYLKAISDVVALHQRTFQL